MSISSPIFPHEYITIKVVYWESINDSATESHLPETSLQKLWHRRQLGFIDDNIRDEHNTRQHQVNKRQEPEHYHRDVISQLRPGVAEKL